MRRGLRLLLALASVLWGGARAAADDAPGLLGGWTLEGAATAGYRLVDVDGADAKYREDYNFREGARLFSFLTDGRAKAPGGPLDRFHLEVDTPGDEPVSHFALSAANRRWFDLSARFTRSQYFYAVPEEFAKPVPGDVQTNDLHQFNTRRTDGTVDLTVHAPNLPVLRLGYRLYQRQGDGSSTVLIPGGDNFVVTAPLDMTTHVGLVGTDFHALGTDVMLQQEYRRVDRELTLGNPLDPAGLDPTDGFKLLANHTTRDEHLDIPATTVRLRRPIGDWLELTGGYFYSHASLGFTGQSLYTATTAPSPTPTTASAVQHGSAALSTHIVDLGGTMAVTRDVLLNVAYRYNERTQSGSIAEQSVLGPFATATGDQLRVHSVTSDLEYEPREDLTLRGGVRYNHRDVNLSLSGDKIATDTVGAVGSFNYRPWSAVNLWARYENVQIDDPLLVPGDPNRIPALPGREAVLTFVNRAAAGLRLAPWDWVSLSYQLIADSRENASFAGSAQSFGNGVALTLTPLAGLSLMTSYTRRDLSDRADILVGPLYDRALSVQQGSEDVFTSSLRWDFSLLGQKWAAGSDVFYVDSNDTLRPSLEPGAGLRTAFDLRRVDGGVFLTWLHPLVEPGIEFRMIDYRERVLPQNDYRATIVVFRLTKRFNL
ncbi:MAG TPA: hypothetical protein VKW76_04550 [Candidatus Binatia bacterium]|nr:hypothetical protein [Candidatus Binatia bacterium]